MKKLVVFLAISMMCVASAQAIIAYDWDGTTNINRWNAGVISGNIFTVNSDITVTKLGNFDISGNITASPIELYEVGSLTDTGNINWGKYEHSFTGTLLASALVGPGQPVELIGGGQYITLATPVALTAGKTYLLSEDSYDGRYITDELSVAATGVTIGSAITHLDDFYAYAGQLPGGIVNIGSTADPGSPLGGGDLWTGGPNMIYIPEPATICLLGIGALSLIRRKRA